MGIQKELLPNYINGSWLSSKSDLPIDVTNPATGEVLTRVPVSTASEINLAVQAAEAAFSEWKGTPLAKRIALLSSLRDLLIKNSEELAKIITTEHGKVLSDARGEMQRVIENATKSLDINLTHGKMLSNIATGRIDEYSMRVPRGVFFAVTPFNFPAMIAFWFLPYALLCGNTFIVKPSEQTPQTMNRIFELIDEAGFPAGVLNLLYGDKRVVDQLLAHPGIVGVCSVTSTPAMEAIEQKAALNHKSFICQGGAKNSVVVLPDIEQNKIVPHIIDSFYGNTGQRCLAGGNLIIVGHSDRRYKSLVQKIIQYAQEIRIGNGLEEGVTMGPLISQASKTRIETLIQKSIDEGAYLLLDGRNIRVRGYHHGYWLGPSIFTDVMPEMAIAREEVFGPVIPILRAETLDEAIEIANKSRFGNAGMIFTSSGKAKQKFIYEVDAGNLGVNIGLPAPIPPFPFVGMKDSFRGDLHGQGEDPIHFFTQEKVIIERWL